MKTKFLLTIITASILFFAGCKKDNYTKPNSIITGKLVYQGQPLGVRSNGVQLELWQKGYQLFTKVAVYPAQDGTYTINVFDGDYQLIPLKGTGPWADKLDTIPIHLAGSANVDITMDPYFIIKNESFVRSGSTITGTFTIQKVNTTKTLSLVKIYIGQTLITDNTNNAANAQKLAATITDITQPISISLTVPAALATKDYAYMRVGVQATGVTELLYTQVQKIALK